MTASLRWSDSLKDVQVVERAVLVVDDDPSVRQYLGDVLQRYFPHCRVAMAVDGMEARGKLLENLPHVVIMDMGLPDQSGLEVCRYIQEHPWLRKTRVLAITGNTAPDVAAAFFTNGAVEFLHKPFKVSELSESLKRLLA